MKKIRVIGFIVFLASAWLDVAHADHHALKIDQKEGVGVYLFGIIHKNTVYDRLL